MCFLKKKKIFYYLNLMFYVFFVFFSVYNIFLILFVFEDKNQFSKSITKQGNVVEHVQLLLHSTTISISPYGAIMLGFVLVSFGSWA